MAGPGEDRTPAAETEARPGALPIVKAPAPAGPPPVRVSGAVEALRWGLRASWACRGPLAFMLAANFLAAVLVLYPLLGPMDASLSNHPEASRIGAGLDYRWWTDWTIAAAGPIERAIGTLGVASFAVVILATFFAGGILEAVRQGPIPRLAFEPLPDPYYKGAIPEWRSASPAPGTVRSFLRASAGHFPRFAALLAISIPFYMLVHAVLNVWAVRGLERLVELVHDERLGVALGIARAVLFVAAFHAVTVVFEYARAHEVLKPGTPILRLLALPWRILAARPAAFLGIEIGAILLQGAALLAFLPIDRLLGAWPPAAATAGFAATQGFLFVRFAIRAAAQAAQLRLAQAHLKIAD